MAVKTSITKRIGRWIGALIASVIAALIGLNQAPAAETACSLHEARTWQAALTDERQELSPAYLYEVTADFLTACPDRPEQREAHQVAARAAADMGDVTLALTHFEEAGWVTGLDAQLTYAGALLADGQKRRAWALRDEAVRDWTRRLKRLPAGSVTERSVPGGTLYSVHTFSTDGDLTLLRAWTAIPDGPGWPATLSFGQDRQISAFRQIRHKATADEITVDLYRCEGRSLLAHLPAALTDAEMEEAATTALTAYLTDPDTRPRAASLTCHAPHRLLPSPQR